LISIERYVEGGRLYLHLNVSKYDLESSTAEGMDFYILCEEEREG
jgi:hypothetical protein